MTGEGGSRNSNRYWRGAEASRLGAITDRDQGRGSEKKELKVCPPINMFKHVTLIQDRFFNYAHYTATEATNETQNSLKEKKEKERLMRTLKGFGITK